MNDLAACKLQPGECPGSTCGLQELQEQFRAMLEAFDGFIYVCSQDYKIEFMNQKLIERTGYDATGEPCYKVLHQRDSVCPWCVNERVFKGETVKWEVLSPRDNRWYYIVNTPIFHADGRISKQALILDITDRKKAEEERRNSEEKCRTLVEGSSDGIVMIDNDGRIVSFNTAFLKLFGLGEEDALGKHIGIVHRSRESTRMLWQTIKDAMEDPGSISTEWDLVRKDGTVFPAEATITQIKGHDGRWKGRVAIIRDITKRRVAENELAAYRAHLEEMVRERTRDLEVAQRSLVQREKLKTLGAISAEVAHEIRNPLTSIGGFAKRLKKKFPNSVEAGIILHESRRLENLLDRISSYLKPIPLKYESCHIGSSIDEIAGMLSDEFQSQGITTEFEIGSDLSSVYLDPTIFTEALLNVIRTAMTMMDRSRPLVLHTFESGQNVHLHFRVPVKGHKVVNPELLFLPFSEGERLMLSISSRLIDAMGGSFSMAQEQEWAVIMISMPKSPQTCPSQVA